MRSHTAIILDRTDVRSIDTNLPANEIGIWNLRWSHASFFTADLILYVENSAIYPLMLPDDIAYHCKVILKNRYGERGVVLGPTSYEYEAAQIQIALECCPPVVKCKCGWPKLKDKPCTRCKE